MGHLRDLALLGAALVFTLGSVSEGRAAGHQQTLMRMAGRIDIVAVNPWHHGSTPTGGIEDTPQGRADVAVIKAALETALTESDDMRTKVDDALMKRGGKLTIMVFRDSSEVKHGNANPSNGVMRIDLGDVENIAQELLASNSPEAVMAVADSFLIRLLAHEMDHLRDAAEMDHDDPSGERAALETGPAVSDANQVVADLGEATLAKRTCYADSLDGETFAAFRVDLDGDRIAERTVIWFPFRTTRASPRSGTSRHAIAGGIFSVPYMPCPTPGLCYATCVNADSDLDGVPDKVDNCPSLVNPQQSEGDDCVPVDANLSMGADPVDLVDQGILCPEPAPGVLALASLLTIAVLARRRRAPSSPPE